MVDSLRDQLLKSGIVKQVREEARAAAPAPHGRTAQRGGGKNGGKNRKGAGGHAPRDRAASGEIDLAKAYAIRAQTEAGERRKAEQEAAEQARLKRERKAKIQQLLAGQALNKPDAEVARHFEYGGKIRRIYLDAAQLAAVNAGELGVVQQNGRYLVLPKVIVQQVAELEPRLLALLVDPAATAEADDGVPDDLVW